MAGGVASLEALLHGGLCSLPGQPLLLGPLHPAPLRQLLCTLLPQHRHQVAGKHAAQVGLDGDSCPPHADEPSPQLTPAKVFLNHDRRSPHSEKALPGNVASPDLLDDDHFVGEKFLPLGLQRVKDAVAEEDLAPPNLPLSQGNIQRAQDVSHGQLLVAGQRIPVLGRQTPVLGQELASRDVHWIALEEEGRGI